MQNRLKYFALVMLLLIQASCDLSKYPIDDPAQVKIDNRLIGKWKVHEKNGDNTLYTVTRQDGFHYKVTTTMKVKKKSKSDTYSAFLSDINNAPFLNVYYKDDSGKDNGYFFLKILDISPNMITTATFKDSTLKYLTGPAQVRERITKNLNNPEFYGDTTHLSRVK